MDKFFTGLGISLILFGCFLVYQRNNPDRIAFAKSDIQINEPVVTEQKNPNRISINSINVDLPIFKSTIKNKKWEVVDNGVSYLEDSVVPGQLGNSILYGHNWTNLLGNLINIKTGDLIVIHYDDGSKNDFILTLIQEVEPSNVSILENTNDKRITLYTCSGFLDSKRFVVVAILK